MAAFASKGYRSLTNRYSQGFITYFQTIEFHYSWTIFTFENWLALAEDKVQQSPTFSSGQNAEYQWKLQFRAAKPSSEEDKAYCQLNLKLISAPTAVKATFQLTMKKDNNDDIVKRSTRHHFEQDQYWGWSKFIAMDELLDQITHDALIISCIIEVVLEKITKKETEVVISIPRDNLSNDLSSLIEQEKFGDVTIIVGNQKFLAYKGILAARSPVFAAMFNHEMEENIQNIVTITDMDAAVFKELLKYIYTDKIDNLSKVAYRLFTAADKYCIEPLKTLCEQSILANLSISNAAKTLEFADAQQATEMKSRVIQFLSSGAACEVVKTADWLALKETHPQLISEALEAICSLMPKV